MQYVQSKHAEQCSNLLGTLMGKFGQLSALCCGDFHFCVCCTSLQDIIVAEVVRCRHPTRNVLLPNMPVSCTH